VQADSVVPIQNSNSKDIKQIQLSLIVDYPENNLLTQLNKMYRDNLIESSKAREEQNKGKDQQNSKHTNNNIEDVLDDDRNKKDEIQSRVYFNEMNDIGKMQTTDYQDDKITRSGVLDPLNGMPSQINIISLDRFAYTSNCPTSYTDPSGHCDIAHAIGSGAVVILGLGIAASGVGLIIIGVGELVVASPTFIGILHGLGMMGIGGLLAGEGVLITEKGVQGISNSDCIPGLE